MHCAVCSVQFTVCSLQAYGSMQCAVNSVQCAVCCVLCAVCMWGKGIYLHDLHRPVQLHAVHAVEPIMVASAGSAWTRGSIRHHHPPLVLSINQSRFKIRQDSALLWRKLENFSVWGLDRFIRLVSVLMGVYYTINWTGTPPWKGSSGLVNMRHIYTTSVWRVGAAVFDITLDKTFNGTKHLHFTKHWYLT